MAQAKIAAPAARLDSELARRLLSQMALIRRFEEKAAEMYAMGKIGGFPHLYIRQEAVAVWATSVWRPHARARACLAARARRPPRTRRGARPAGSGPTAWPRARPGAGPWPISPAAWGGSARARA